MIKLKYIPILLLLLLFNSCKESTAKPIDIYRNKNVIVVGDPQVSYPDDALVRCKTQDSVFYIRIPYYDGKDLKPGDTIK